MQKTNFTEEKDSLDCNTIEVITNKTMDVRRKCDRCGSSFTKLYEYYKHRVGCQGKLSGSPKTCRHCRQEFQFLSLYRKHLLTCWKWHQNMKSREKCQLKNCSVSKAFLKKKEKIKELSIPSESSSPSQSSKIVDNKLSKYSTVCPLCQQSFRSTQNYKLHLKKKGLCRPKPYICNACGHEFLSAHHLLSHENRKIPCTSKSEKCKRIPKGNMFVNKSLKQYKYQNYDRSESSTADGSTSSYDEERNYKNAASLECFGGSHCTTSDNEISEIILGTEIHNSPIRDVKMYKDYFNYRNSHPSQRTQLSSHNLNLENNIDISDCICKGCEVVFLYPHEAEKHFEQNPKCYAITEKWKTTELLEHLNENEIKQTARKSFPTIRSTGMNNYKKENIFDSGKTENTYLFNNSNKGSSIAKKSDCVILGSARKSSQDASSTPSWKIEKKCNEDKSNLVCDICHAEFLSLQSLNEHMRKHSSQKKSSYVTKCPVCFQVFYNTFLLFSHQKKFHHWGKATKTKTADCKCPFCDKVFVYVRSRNAHLRSHAERASEDIENFLQKTTCEVCSQAFISESLKIQHLKVAHPDWTRALPKLFSNIELRNQAYYKRTHEQKNSSDKALHIPTHKYKYVGFSKNMKVMVSITPAIRAKLKKHPTICPICLKHYSTSFVRNRHFRMHTLDTAFECKWCPTKFPRSDRLTSHMQQNHNELLGFECLGCGLRFLTRVRTLQHIGKVHTNQPSKTLVKERKVSSLQKAQLVKFNETASTNEINSVKVIEVKSFPNEISSTYQDAFFCEVCKIGFLKLCGLQRHRQSKNHRDCLANNQKVIPPVVPQNQVNVSKLLKCSVCSQVFTSVMNFVPHRLSHFNIQSIDLSQISDVNPYQCEICMQLLDHHQRVQLHLLWHLRTTKSKNLFSSHRDNFGLGNTYLSRKEIYDIKTGGLQVAKKSISNKPDKHFQQELIIGGIKKHLFTCDACNIGFTTKHHYSAHVRRYCQVRKASLKVDTYIELEKSPSGLRNKWRLLPPERKLLCHHCSLEFNTVDDLGWHEKSCRKVNSSEKGNYNDIKKEICYCKICKCLFSSEESFQEHKTISSCTDFQLGSSSSTFSGEDENVNLLKSTMEYETSVAGCIRCGLTFSSLHSLTEHMDLHKSKSEISDDVNEENLEITSRKDDEKLASGIKDETEHNVPELLREHLVTNSDTSFNENIHLDPPTLHEADLQFQHKISPKTLYNENLVENNMKQSDTSCITLDAAKGNCPLNNECSELDNILSCENLDKEDSPNMLEERTSLPEEALDALRDNFSHLLFLLVSDPELMQQLGWGQRLIDAVLEDILQHMGQVPVVYNHTDSDLDRLRKNIQLLLEVCIKDQVMTLVASGKATVDSIVAEVLQMCKDNLEEQSPSIDAVS